MISEDIENQILQNKMKNEGGSGSPSLIITLCEDQVEIRFAERHMLDLQEIIRVSQQDEVIEEGSEIFQDDEVIEEEIGYLLDIEEMDE
ncbi:MAG: hypothetical protein JEZ00_15185 [Anaerolineaceae bacterium]|nr:hypothetical protein [Anaerolineaceae bacterium]